MRLPPILVDGRPYEIQVGDRFNYLLMQDALVCYPDRRGEAEFVLNDGTLTTRLSIGSYWSASELVILLNRALKNRGSSCAVERVENSWPNVYTFKVIPREERKNQ